MVGRTGLPESPTEDYCILRRGESFEIFHRVRLLIAKEKIGGRFYLDFSGDNLNRSAIDLIKLAEKRKSFGRLWERGLRAEPIDGILPDNLTVTRCPG